MSKRLQEKIPDIKRADGDAVDVNCVINSSGRRGFWDSQKTTLFWHFRRKVM